MDFSQSIFTLLLGRAPHTHFISLRPSKLYAASNIEILRSDECRLLYLTECEGRRESQSAHGVHLAQYHSMKPRLKFDGM